jgi:hypothetical protein
MRRYVITAFTVIYIGPIHEIIQLRYELRYMYIAETVFWQCCRYIGLLEGNFIYLLRPVLPIIKHLMKYLTYCVMTSHMTHRI